MKKTTYICPEVEIVLIDSHAIMLDASDRNGQGKPGETEVIIPKGEDIENGDFTKRTNMCDSWADDDEEDW